MSRAGGTKAPRMVRALYRLVSHPMGSTAHVMLPRARELRERKTLQVPLSCLYSLGDGVVPPQEATIDGDPRFHENVQVPGSHIGLGFNGVVLSIVADRLAQPEEGWKPFRPEGILEKVYRITGSEDEPS